MSSDLSQIFEICTWGEDGCGWKEATNVIQSHSEIHFLRLQLIILF